VIGATGPIRTREARALRARVNNFRIAKDYRPIGLNQSF
jgi:hypothetical protein